VVAGPYNISHTRKGKKKQAKIMFLIDGRREGAGQDTVSHTKDENGGQLFLTQGRKEGDQSFLTQGRKSKSKLRYSFLIKGGKEGAGQDNVSR
jgi:hypothetical protein